MLRLISGFNPLQPISVKHVRTIHEMFQYLSEAQLFHKKSYDWRKGCEITIFFF